MHGDDRVADAECPALEHTRGDAAVAAHRVVAARAQRLLHPRAGMTRAAERQQRLPDAEAAVLERDQVDTCDDDVPAHERRVDARHAHERRDGRKVLRLDQRDLARSAAVVVAEQSAVGGEHLGHLLDGHVPCRPHPDPFDAPGAREHREQPRKGAVGVQRATSPRRRRSPRACAGRRASPRRSRAPAGCSGRSTPSTRRSSPRGCGCP